MSDPRTPHEVYVELGYCPAIHTSKAWCCQQDPHAGPHFALRLLTDNTFVVGVRWD